MTLTLELVAVGLLILLNGFFVAAEYALVTARRTRIIELHHQGNKRARAVLRITGDPPQFIAAMQLGVTLTSLGIGALGEHALSKAFDTWRGTGRFENIYVPEGNGGLDDNAYHIKVTVRDGAHVWLSSGNWTRTSQPLIAKADRFLE